jgi:hypothetical protein
MSATWMWFTVLPSPVAVPSAASSLVTVVRTAAAPGQLSLNTAAGEIVYDI